MTEIRNVGHVESTIRQDFHKAKFHEYLDCPLYGANLVPGEGGNGLNGVGKMLVERVTPYDGDPRRRIP